MDDERSLGCSITIHVLNEDVSLDDFIIWLKFKSGLTRDYADKILAVIEEEKCFTVAFDSTASYCTAHGQLTPPKSRSTNNSTINADEEQKASTSSDQLVKITLFTNLQNLELQKVIDEFGSLGVIVELQRLKNNGVNTGEIQLVMYLDEGSDLLKKDWLAPRAAVLKVEPYFAKDYEVKIMHRICNRSGKVTMVPHFP